MQLQHRDRELADLRAHAEATQRHNQELAFELDRVAHSVTWRLRAMVRRVIGAPRAVLRRARQNSGA
jgi:hypothetical protein